MSTTTAARGVTAALAVTGLLAMSACSSPDSATTSSAASGSSAPSGGQVLPVTSDPIDNPATAHQLSIDSVLVENNVDADGTAVDDHLEIAVSNTGESELGGFEVFYTITDPSTGDAESYYTQLPDTFTVPAGGSRVIHFDDTGKTDHFPVNQFSLYYASANALTVDVEVSAQGATPETSSVDKDAGGAEVPD